jgi:hypothetical protein
MTQQWYQRFIWLSGRAEENFNVVALNSIWISNRDGSLMAHLDREKLKLGTSHYWLWCEPVTCGVYCVGLNFIIILNQFSLIYLISWDYQVHWVDLMKPLYKRDVDILNISLTRENIYEWVICEMLTGALGTLIKESNMIVFALKVVLSLH